jgi:hypothetical protein
MNVVRCYLNEKEKLWDEHFPLLASAIRSSYNKNTGFSGNMMMLGRELIQPVDLESMD